MATSCKHDVLCDSVVVRSGPPVVHQLRPNQQNFGTLRKITFGEKVLNQTNRSILLVGETGAGKSVLIDALLNHAMGVQWEDDVWFQIEDRDQTQSEARVMVYQMFSRTLPFSLTLIDTPGYGGPSRTDDIIAQSLLDLFRSEDGVHEVDAVGLVLKASENRLTDRLRYVFDSVTSLFGKDVDMMSLVTHSDGVTPENALQALEDANVPLVKDEEGDPVYFLFNNRQTTLKTEKNTRALKSAWDLTKDQIHRFTDFLEHAVPKKLKTTVDVLSERMRLAACVQSLRSRVRHIEHEESVTPQVHRELQRDKDRWLDETFQHVLRLEQIALNVDSLSTRVHLDFLLEKMKERGDKDKTDKLEKMRHRGDRRGTAGLRYMMSSKCL